MPLEHISFEDYLARPGLNATVLKAGVKSMMHALHAATGERKETPSMRWGSLCHAVLLEPARVERDFAVFDGRKQGKAWDEFRTANAHKEVVTEAEALALSVMAKQVWKNPVAVKLISEGEREVSAFWSTPEYGAAKARFDVLNPNHFVDIKTTAEISPGAFRSTAAKMGYHIQCGWYQCGLRELTGNLLPVYIVCVESDPPHDVAVYEYDEIALAAGRDVAQGVAKKYRECEKAGVWPGVQADIQSLKLPPWMIAGEEPIALKIGGEQVEV